MSDVRVLLLTDLVDSTKLAECLGDAAMAELWARHDRVARDLMVLHRGREIDKTDGFLLLFDTVAEAVDYALAYHRSLRALDLLARAGLHVGRVIVRENSAADIARGAKPLEVEGLAKPTAARVMALAAGRQTLLTAEARVALGSTSLRVESHGHWRMKGLSQPVELFEVGEADASFVPPADAAKVYRVVERDGLWLPVNEVEHNLPRERDTFVGREADLGDLARRLDEGAALVSVLGIGGTGKTRLVIHYGWTWLGDWPGGVWFCDLSEARDAGGITAAVGRALEVPLGSDPVAQLGNAIASRGRCLVLLDNFEQVARGAAATLGDWLQRAPRAAFVVTTREVLGLSGEEVLALPPLGPTEAVALFEARAASAKRGFTLGEADRADVVALVDLLDRLPLCIELAAARVRMMTPKVLVARMGERFQLLAAGGARRDRQATLRGTLDWSWDLLTPGERTVLAQLSVFEGGFSLEAAEAVVDLSGVPDAPWTLDAIQSLVDKSLVRAAGGDRLDLLVSVQVYAAEKLAELGLVAAAERSHAAWFARYGADEAVDALYGPNGPEQFGALGTELDNLVAAIRRATARGDAEVALRNLFAARQVLQLRGPYASQVALARGLLALPTIDGRQRAWAELFVKRAIERQTGVVATDRLDAAWAAGEGVDDPRLRYALHAERSANALSRGRPAEAEIHAEAAVRIATGWEAMACGSIANLAHAQRRQGRLLEADATLQRALSLAIRSGNRLYEMNMRQALYARGIELRLPLSGSGEVAGSLGDEAHGHLRAAYALAVQLRAHHELASYGTSLGTEAWNEGDLAEAARFYQEALSAKKHTGAATYGTAIGHLGYVASAEGRLDDAVRLYREALTAAEASAEIEPVFEWRGSLADALRAHGQLALARGEVARLFAAGEVLPDSYRSWAHVVLAQLELDSGAVEEAWAHIASAWPLSLNRDVYWATRKHVTRVLVHLARGEVAEAAAIVAVAWAAAESTPHNTAYVHAADALVSAASGDRVAAEAALARATTNPALLSPAAELGRLVARCRAALAALPGRPVDRSPASGRG